MLWPALGSLLLHPLRAWPDCQEKSTLQSKLELSTCNAYSIIDAWQGHTTTNQLCWFCDTKWNFNRLHTRPHSCSHWISTASADRATNRPSWEPKFVPVTTELHYRQATAGCHESWDSHSRWWYRETIAVWPECSEAATKIHQKVANKYINLNRSIVKSCSKRNTKWWAHPCREGLPTSFLP